jgi:hypothetical protein
MKTTLLLSGINELNFQQTYTRFTETSTVPRDSKIIGKTWAKVNKNGTRDKRFKSNYQIPVDTLWKYQTFYPDRTSGGI